MTNPVDREGIARSVLGDAVVDETNAGITDFNAPWHEFLSQVAGSIWAREGIDARTKSFITVALLAAMARPAELEVHLRVARRNGITPEEIRETLIHTALYAGVPVIRSAFEIAGRVVDDDDTTG